MSIVCLGYVVAFFSALLYVYSKWKYSYWQRKGVQYIEPDFFYGNTKKFVKKQVAFGVLYEEFYRKFKSMGLTYGGVYSFFKPVLVPTDLDLIKNILQTDFEYFPNHGIYVDEKNDPLTGNLFCLEDEKWKNLRNKLTPTFTSGKLRMMYQSILECTTDLVDVLNNDALIGDPINMKDTVIRFATDVIGSVAFGINCNSLKNPNSEFVTYSKNIFNVNFIRVVKMSISEFFPKWFLMKVGFHTIPRSIENFFMNLVRSTIDYREKNNVYRKDFLHLLMQLKNLGKITDDGTLTKDSTNDGESFLTMEEVVAQCFVFFIAGFETSSTTISFALLELAVNQDVQDKARREIQTVLKKHDGKMTYDALGEMVYLDQIVMETLRKHSPAQKLMRKCRKPYKIPDSDVTIEAGTSLIIPVWAIHRDPDIYPDPEKFDPERFSPENKSRMHPCSFLAFGEGPRICIGMRMGKLESKLALAVIIRNFKVHLNERTSLPIQYESTLTGTSPKGGIWLNMEKVI